MKFTALVISVTIALGIVLHGPITASSSSIDNTDARPPGSVATMGFMVSPTTTPTPAPTTTPAPAPTCVEQANAFLTKILQPHGIANPQVVLDSSIGPNASYSLSGTITIKGCASESVLAHEAGHYIHHLASGDWGTMAFDSGNFCLGHSSDTGRCESGWLSESGKSSEARVAPGVEHAAHCIGHALGVSGSYTKCPDAHLFNEALARIGSAA